MVGGVVSREKLCMYVGDKWKCVDSGKEWDM
jgi:hypothetical protein